MIRRSAAGRLLAAVALLVGSLSAAHLAAPGNVFACYCAGQPMAAFVHDPTVVVLVGTIVDPDTAPDEFVQRGTIEISHIFKGPGLVPSMPIFGGNSADCGAPIRNGREYVMAASLDDGNLIPSICLAFGWTGTPDGRQLLADAAAAFGSATPTSVSDATMTEVLLFAGFVLVAVVAGAAGMFAVIVFFSRRRKPA